MFQKPKTSQPAYMLAGVLFTAIAIVALVALFMLKSKADTALQTANPGNVAPTVDSIAVSESSQGADIGLADIGSGFTPNEGTTKNIYVAVDVNDSNGCKSVTGGSVTLYRSSVAGGAACTPDTNNCYYAEVGPGDFTGCTGAGVDSLSFETTFSLPNYVDPTDAGSPLYSDDNWVASVTVTDNAAAPGTLTRTFDVNSLAALNIPSPTIAYGQVALGTDSSQVTLPIENSGNVPDDANVVALIDAGHVPPLVGDMTSNLTGFDNIAASAVHYSLTDGFTYGTGDTAISKDASTNMALNLPQQTEDGVQNIPSVDTFWKLHMPSSGVNGTYTNTLVFTAKTAAGGGVSGPIGVLSQKNIPTIKGSVVNSDISYVAESGVTTGLVDIYNVSNPNEATLISTVSNTINNANDVTYWSGEVILTNTDTSDNMQILDVTTPSNPIVASTITAMSGGVKGISISSGYAYVIGTDTEGNFKIYNVESPTSPTLFETSVLTVTSSANTAVDVIAVKAAGNRAYVYSTDPITEQNRHGYLTVIDVSYANAPVVLSVTQVDIADGKLAISFYGDYAYIAGFNSDSVGTVLVYDTATMEPVGSISVNASQITDVAWSDDILYVADMGTENTNNLTAINVAAASDPTILATAFIGSYNALGTGYTSKIAVDNDTVYFSGVGEGIYYICSGAKSALPPQITMLNSTSLPDPLVVVQNNSGDPLTLFITGTNFVAGEEVLWNGGTLPLGTGTVSLLGPSAIMIQNIPSSAFSVTGLIDITVRSPANISSNVAQISVIGI